MTTASPNGPQERHKATFSILIVLAVVYWNLELGVAGAVGRDTLVGGIRVGLIVPTLGGALAAVIVLALVLLRGPRGLKVLLAVAWFGPAILVGVSALAWSFIFTFLRWRPVTQFGHRGSSL